MDNNNLISFLVGISMLATGCTIAFFFQKYLFSKYRGKVKNVVKKETG